MASTAQAYPPDLPAEMHVHRGRVSGSSSSQVLGI